MFKNYLMVSFRNILKNKVYSAINIAGLSVGLSAVMLITLYIWDEFTFDSYLNTNDNLYKLELRTDFPGRGVSDNPVSPGALAVGVLAEYPEIVANSARLQRQRRTITVGDMNISEEINAVDPSFLELFNLDFLEGSAANALSDVSSVAISRSSATKYFGDGLALGETLLFDNGKSYRVSAVFKDWPRNTHIRPNFLISTVPSNRDLVSEEAGWWQIGFFTYVQLQDGVAVAELQKALSELVDKHVEPLVPTETASLRYGFNILPISNVHFETAAPDAGDPLMLSGFGAIAFVILLIATFNFMNMSISRTVSRAREVAVRKVFGADKKNIISLIMSETIVTVVISLFIAMVVTEMSLLWFNDFVSKLMSLGVFASPAFFGGLVVLVGTVALGAGFYPASILSNFRPAVVLGGGRSEHKNVTRLGTILVTAQFAVAIALIISATIIYQQIQYSQSMDPGYRKENMLLISGLQHPAVNPSVGALKQRLLDHPDIADVTLIDQAPGGTYGWMESVRNVDGTPLERPITVRGMYIDQDFIKTFGMRMIAGRTLSEDRADDYARRREGDYADSYNIMINEQAVKLLGLGTPVEAIGKTMGQDGAWTIVGVVGDYLLGSSKSNVPPMLFSIDEQSVSMLALRFKTNDVSKLLADIDAVWTDIAGARPIRRQFMDDRIAALYQVEQRQGEIFALFAALAVVVSCIGLYGLASFSVAKRTKEIGLKKILGASTPLLARQIIWDFSKPVLVANLIAWPAAGYLMSDWLTNFNYRIELDAVPFMAAAALAFALAALTVGSHAIRVATANPIKALRHE